MNYQLRKTFQTLQKIEKSISKLSDYELKYYYKAGLGFYCSSPYFLNFYIIISVYDETYQIQTYRNNLIDKSYSFKKYDQYSIIKDIIEIYNKEIEYELRALD